MVHRFVLLAFKNPLFRVERYKAEMRRKMTDKKWESDNWQKKNQCDRVSHINVSLSGSPELRALVTSHKHVKQAQREDFCLIYFLLFCTCARVRPELFYN